VTNAVKVPRNIGPTVEAAHLIVMSSEVETSLIASSLNEIPRLRSE